jgi:hypothetical protein
MFIKIIKYSMSSKNTTTKRKKKGIPKDVSIDDWVEKQVSKQPIIKEETIISYCDTYNPETTLFISIASHASLLLDAEGLPIVVECPLRNVEKKNVSNIGICAKRFMASPFFADPEKIHQLLETDFISESRKTHIRSLSEKTYYREIINILDEILFTPESPITLCSSIINDYERNGCNFARTYPTISSIEQSYSLYLALKQKIMERETPLPIEPLIREKFSCNIQKDKPLYWNTLYNMEDESEIYDSIIFSYVLRGERKFYNVFFKNDLYRLFRDIKETTSSKGSTSSSDSSEPIDEFNRDIKNIKRRLKGKEMKRKKDIYYVNFDTTDLFHISKVLQDYCNIEKILITDFSCKSTENEEKNSEYRDSPLGYGGTKKRGTKKRLIR